MHLRCFGSAHISLTLLLLFYALFPTYYNTTHLQLSNSSLSLSFSPRRHRFVAMMWHDYEDEDDSFPQNGDEQDHDSPSNFDFFSLLSKHKDYYKILEVDYDATDDTIRSNYIRLALKWHPDKKKDQDEATSRFQEINEAYQVLSDPVKRSEYDSKGMLYVHDYNIVEYLNRYKGLILTCNGLGIQQPIW